MNRLDDTTVGVPDHPGRSGGALQALARPGLPAASAGDGERPLHAPWNQKRGRGVSAAHKITARGYLITATLKYMRGLGVGIQGATSAVDRGRRATGGSMIPKDCKRLSEVDFPMPRSTSTRRERSAVEVWGRGTNRVIEMCERDSTGTR